MSIGYTVSGARVSTVGSPDGVDDIGYLSNSQSRTALTSPETVFRSAIRKSPTSTSLLQMGKECSQLPPNSPCPHIGSLSNLKPLNVSKERFNGFFVTRVLGDSIFIANHIISEVQTAFDLKGLVFARDFKCLDRFLCSDSTFSDIQEIAKSLSSEVRDYIGEFFYDPDKRSICCILGTPYHIVYPKTQEWIPLLKRSRECRVETISSLVLTDGRACFETEFVNDPLFKSSLEKYSVFRRLCILQKDPSFERDYNDFLRAAKTGGNSWAEPYQSKPIEMAYLALFAFLDRQINQEELFVAHMLARAFLESPDTVAYTVLTSDNAEDHLIANHYLRQIRSNPEIACLTNLEEKTTLERTTVSYGVGDGIDKLIFDIYKAGDSFPMGFRESSREAEPSFITVLPPWLCKAVYQELFSENFQGSISYPPTAHAEYFGYREVIKDLLFGRPISYASPLFYIPQVHGVLSKQLSITAHDLVAHAPADWMHPHAKKLIALGAQVHALRDPQLLPLALALLDRAVEPRTEDSEENVCRFMLEINDSLVISKLSSVHQEIFFSLCSDLLPKNILDKISKFYMKNGRCPLFLGVMSSKGNLQIRDLEMFI